MATYNSAQNGNWNTDATWTESGHPNANDDVMIITHDVTYDVGASAITWGNVTINSGGVLIFPTNADSTILFNVTGVLTINDGGELRAGTSTTPVSKDYDCKFHWPQGTSVRNALVLNNGGAINLYGDLDYYGSERYADLDSDWTTGQVLYITGDYSSKWQAGQKFYIHKNIQYVNYLTDSAIFTIATVGSYDGGNDRTPITISETAPGISFYAIANTHQSNLIMLSRNIEMADKDSNWDICGFNSYTERINFDNNQTADNKLINIQDVVIRGWNTSVNGGVNYKGENILFLNNYYATGQTINCQITGDIVSSYMGLYNSNNCQFTGSIACSMYSVYGGENAQITGYFIGSGYGIYFIKNAQIIGNSIGNNTGTYVIENTQITGNFINNNIGVYTIYNTKIVGDFIGNSTDIIQASQSNKYITVLEDCLFESIDRTAYEVYGNSGNFIYTISTDSHWQTPPSANDWILECIPNSYCDNFHVNQMELSPLNPIGLYCESGSNTITFKIYPIGWTTALDNDDVVLEIKYLDSASGITRTEIVNTTATYANGAWRNISVTFTAGQGGIAYCQLYMKKYESGCYLLIDPVSVVS